MGLELLLCCSCSGCCNISNMSILHRSLSSICHFSLPISLTLRQFPEGLPDMNLLFSFPYSCFYNFGICSMRRLLEMYNPLDRLASCKGFLWVTLIILAGQILIVSLGGALFSVTPLQPMDWVYIFVATSAVLWIGEIYRLIRRWIA